MPFGCKTCHAYTDTEVCFKCTYKEEKIPEWIRLLHTYLIFEFSKQHSKYYPDVKKHPPVEDGYCSLCVANAMIVTAEVARYQDQLAPDKISIDRLFDEMQKVAKAAAQKR